MGAFNPALTRSELLKVLSDMGITIPSTSKLPDDALEHRLKQAINASQALSSAISRPPLDLSRYAKWPSNSARSVYEAVRRGDFNEALKTTHARLQGFDDFAPLHSSAFMDLRQTLMGLAKSWDEGMDVAIVQDAKKEKCAINLHIIDVFEVNDSTPLLVVLYLPATSANPRPGIKWIQELQVRRAGFMMQSITSTELEQKLMIKILVQNSHFMPPDFVPTRMDSEKDFKVSFLLPMGPLAYEDLGKLNLDTGCSVCGKRVISRCSQCQAVSYCGAGCQKEDWPSHKSACRSLKGGVWLDFPMANCIPGTEGKNMFHFNRFNFSSKGGDKDVHPEAPPPNDHGDKLFLVKIQLPAMGNGHMLIYDRQRTFETYLLEEKAPAAFRKVRDEMQSPRGGFYGMKMYRWARRHSDWELSLCLDKAPQEPIVW